MTYNTFQSAQHRAERNKQAHLGRELRRLYAGVASEPVPEHLLSLLSQADQRLSPESNLK
jgi:hypothetical protein